MSEFDKYEKDYEKDAVGGVTEVVEDVKVDVHTGLYDGVKRTMKQRHIQMIALAGTLGTGLFLGSGKAIAHAGPAGALLAYMLIGSVTYCMMLCLGEMAVFAPISGGYLHYAGRWADPALGFALGWNTWYSSAISNPTEIISASVVISYWDSAFPKSHQVGYLIGLMVAASAVNYLGARWFGESEFIFAFIKIALVLGLILAGLIVDLGGGPDHKRIGFQYWNNPGAFAPYLVGGNLGKFLGWFTTLLQAAYSYLGMETIAMCAAETENPRRSIATAVKRIFIRILLFYVLGILVVGMLVPYNDPDLLQSTGTSASSPFVIAFTRAGIRTLPGIINAAVLTSAFSAANSGIYAGSRQLYGLALRGQAPRIFAYTTKGGLPIIALSTTVLFLLLSFLSLSNGGETALNWLSNLTSISGFITWGTISFTYLRFYAGVKAQGLDRSKFYYANRFQPWPAYWCLFWCAIVIVFNGYYVFLNAGRINGHFDTTDFILSYINIPIFILLFVFWKFFKKTTFYKPEDMDFVSNIPKSEEVDFEEHHSVSWKNPIAKIFDLLFA